jgi:glycosyltransferase involved in cell wall biosynthesis
MIHEAASMSDRLRLCIVISGLGVGGAEHALLNTLSRIDRSQFDVSLIVLGSWDALAPRFRDIGVEPVMLGLGRGRWPLRDVQRFVDAVRAARPDVIQGWMYHGNLAASFANARLHPAVPVCWSVRDTPDTAHALSRFTHLVIRLCGWYLPRVARIFNVSARSAAYCVEHLGWPAALTELLPNGIDTARFTPDRAARAATRLELNVRPDAPVIGMVASWSPVKNHPLFLQAAARVREQRPDAVFVLIGRNMNAANAELMRQAGDLGLTDSLRLLGERDDVASLYPGFDVAVLTSRSEGFPNVLAEAMSCGVPVVSTDVGDARDIVGTGGRIVDAIPASFAAACLELLDEPTRVGLGETARRHIQDRYALDAMVLRLQGSYRNVVTSPA